MSDISDLRRYIIPKSDQLNSEQLLGGPITVTVTGVTIGGDDQPVIVHYEGEDGRPFKPCKTMRKLLLIGWGEDGRTWPGKAMTLYCDPTVKFGGMDVGGIRISHMSDIKSPIRAALTATKGKKTKYVVEVLAQPTAQAATLPAVLSAIAGATTREAIDACKAMAGRLASDDDKASARAAFAARVAELKAKNAKPGKTLEQYVAAIDEAADAGAAKAIIDEAAGVLANDQMLTLRDAFGMAWGA